MSAQFVASVPTSRLEVVERSISLEQVKGKGASERSACWQIDYRLRLDSKTELKISQNRVNVRIDSIVSNSAAAGHSVPHRSLLNISGGSAAAATFEIVASSDDSHKCCELGSMQFWVEKPADPYLEPATDPSQKMETQPGPVVGGAKLDREVVRADTVVNPTFLTIAPGQVVHVQLRLEHRHDLFGSYDPLLGLRTIDLELGGFAMHDCAPLDRDRRIAPVEEGWTSVPADRSDSRYFVSKPDSLHLEAHVPGNQSYRFPDRAIRHGIRTRLVYWYLIAPGTVGECRSRLAQYRDTPISWKVLDEGTVEEELKVVGRWTRVERLIKIEHDATALALEFRINGCEVGEVWIDDVSLEPVAEHAPQGP